MGKISTYEVAAYNPEAIIIGTEPDSLETKNYRLGDIPQGGGGGGFVSGKRGRFFSTETQSVFSINVQQYITFTDTDTDVTDGITLATNINNDLGRITATIDGVYNLSFMINWNNLGAQQQSCNFFLKKNGLDVANSIYGLSTKEDSHTVNLTYMVKLDVGDYIEIIWWPSTLNQELVGTVFSNPVIASVVATINQV